VVGAGRVVDGGDGSYRVTYSLEQTGRYLIAITDGGFWRVHVFSGLVLLACLVVSHLLLSADSYHTCQNARLPPPKKTSNLTTTGEGAHVADSPYPLLVLPGPPSLFQTTTSGAAHRTATATQPAAFTVQARDALGNPCDNLAASELTAALRLRARLRAGGAEGVGDIGVVCLAQGGGKWECAYSVQQPGLYVLEVLVGEAAAGEVEGGQAPRTAAGGGGSGGVEGKDERASGWRHVRGSPSGVRVVEALPAASAGAESAGGRPVLVRDVVSWWGEVSRREFGGMDGSMEGFEGAGEAAHAAATPEASFVEVRWVWVWGGAGGGRSQCGCRGGREGEGGWTSQSRLVVSNLKPPTQPTQQAHPGVAVVERLEDLWLLSKLQRERGEGAGRPGGKPVGGDVAPIKTPPAASAIIASPAAELRVEKPTIMSSDMLHALD